MLEFVKTVIIYLFILVLNTLGCFSQDLESTDFYTYNNLVSNYVRSNLESRPYKKVTAIRGEENLEHSTEFTYEYDGENRLVKANKKLLPVIDFDTNWREEIIIEYGAFNKVSYYLHQDWYNDENRFEPSYSFTIFRNDEGLDTLFQYIDYGWNMWNSKMTKVELRPNKFGELILRSMYYSNDSTGSWLISSEKKEYDLDDLTHVMVTYMYNNESSEITVSDSVTTTRDFFGNIVRLEEKDYQNIYLYDSSNNIKESQYYRVIEGELVPLSKNSHTYFLDSTLLERKIRYRYIKEKWEKDKMEEVLRDEKSNVIRNYYEYNASLDTWVMKFEEVYNSNRLISYFCPLEYHEYWIYSPERCYFSYNSEGGLIRTKRLTWDDELQGWELNSGSSIKMEYNGNNQLNKIYNYRWSTTNQEWELHSDQTFYYYEKSSIPEMVNSIKVYPNPATDFACIDSEILEIEPAYYEIVDLKGNLSKKDILSNNNSIDISELNSGFYIIKVTFKKSGVKVAKFMKY